MAKLLPALKILPEQVDGPRDIIEGHSAMRRTLKSNAGRIR